MLVQLSEQARGDSAWFRRSDTPTAIAGRLLSCAIENTFNGAAVPSPRRRAASSKKGGRS